MTPEGLCSLKVGLLLCHVSEPRLRAHYAIVIIIPHVHQHEGTGSDVMALPSTMAWLAISPRHTKAVKQGLTGFVDMVRVDGDVTTIAERAVSRRHLGEHPMSPRHGRPRPLRHTPKGRWARAAPSALLGAVKCPLGAHKAATGRTGGRKSLSTKFVDFRPEKRSFPESAISGTA